MKWGEMVKPLVSIILPVYNAERYIERCLVSIIKQTYKPIEIILINDGSTDSSPAVMKKFAFENDCIKYIEKANSGVSDSRNLGIEKAKGEYIYFIDSDDWIEMDALESLYHQFEVNKEIQFAVSGVYFDSKNNTKVVQTEDCVIGREEALVSLFNDGYIRPVVWGKLIKYSLLQNNKITFDKDIFYSEDVMFVFEMLINSRKVAIISKPLYHYIQYNEDSAMKTLGKHKEFNTKWLTKWEAYKKIEDILANTKMKSEIVSREFISSRVEVARDIQELFYCYKIKDKEWNMRLQSYVKKNMLIYLKTRRVSIMKKIVMIINYFSPLLTYRLKKILK